MAGFVIRHLRLPAPSREGPRLHFEHIHKEGVDVHRLLGQLVDGVAVLVGHLARHLGPQGTDGFRTGRARRDDKVEGAFLEDVHVVLDHFFKAFKVARGQGRNAAARIVRGQIDADFVIIEDLEAGFGNVGEELVAHAAGEEGHLVSAFPGRGVDRAHLGAERLPGERRHVPIPEDGTQQRRTGGRPLRVVILAHGQPLKRSAQLHEQGEQLRIGQQCAENGFLDGRKALVGGDDGARLHEDFEDGNPRGAIGLTGAAQQAAVQLLVHRFRVFDQPMSQIFQQRELAAGHVGFHERFTEHGTHGLAHAAFHAGGELVVQRHQGV